MRRVTGGVQQQRLFGAAAEEPVPGEESAPRLTFVDPSPEVLTIGPQSLREYLEATKQTWPIAVRALLRSADFSPFLACYEAKGRAPYHPAVMVGLILVALTRGSRSLRQIEAFARENVCAWWVTGGACPDHASIGRFVTRFGALLSGRFFEELTGQILAATGSSAGDLAGDGTTVPSMARRFGLLTEEAARSQAQSLRRQAERTEGKHKEKLEKKAAKLERAADCARREVKRTGRKPAERSVKVAVADPEATNQRLKNGLPAPSYKPTILANEARVVVAHDVQSSSEAAAVPGLCAQARRVNGDEKLNCVRFDAGFYSADVMDALLAEEVENPLVTDRAVVESKRAKRPTRFTKSDFVHDPVTDTLKCPAGHELRLVKHRKVRATKIYGGAPCEACPLRDQCTTSKQGREVLRYETRDPKLLAMKQVMENPLARADYAKRSAMVEPVFSDMRRKGFNRFLRAGLARVRIEFALVALAHNLDRYLILAGEALRGATAWLLALSNLSRGQARRPVLSPPSRLGYLWEPPHRLGYCAA